MLHNISQKCGVTFLTQFLISFRTLLVASYSSKRHQVEKFAYLAILNNLFYYIFWSYFTNHVDDNLPFRCFITIIVLPLFFEKKIIRNHTVVFSLYWYFCITIYLPCFFTFLFLSNPTNCVFSMALDCVILVLIMICSWKIFPLLFFAGVLIGWLVFIIKNGQTPVFDWCSILVQAIGSIIFGFVFSKENDQNENKRVSLSLAHSNKIFHESIKPIKLIKKATRKIEANFDSLQNSKCFLKNKKCSINLECFMNFFNNVKNQVEKTIIITEASKRLLESIEIEKTIFNTSFFLNKRWLEQNYQDINIHVNKNSYFLIEADKTLIELTFMNLLNNSEFWIKSRNSGEVFIYGNNKNILFFKDTAIGIDKSKYHEFFQGKHTTNSSGFGLVFCKNVMHSLGGDIEVHDSKLGEYVIFKLTFPKISKKPIKKAFAKLEYNKL